MSLTFYIICTLPLLAMVVTAFVSPQRDVNGPADEKGATTVPPRPARPAVTAPPVVHVADRDGHESTGREAIPA